LWSLETVAITKTFFGPPVLSGVAIQCEQGRITGLIGPNGSGKTTLFNCITNVTRPDSGAILLEGENITGLNIHQRALRGIARTYQIVRLFREMSVVENMLLAIQQHQSTKALDMVLQRPNIRKFEHEALKKSLELLDFVEIAHLKDSLAGNISYGQQKLLEFAMALLPSPKIILLDEPAAAINPVLINKMVDHIASLNRQGQTFLIIEHNMDVIMSICSKIIVLDQGRKLVEGAPAEIQNNQLVMDAYFGG